MTRFGFGRIPQIAGPSFAVPIPLLITSGRVGVPAHGGRSRIRHRSILPRWAHDANYVRCQLDSSSSVVRHDVCHVHWSTMSTQVAPGSSTAVEEKTRPSFDDGDAERFSHYVPKAKLTDAMVNGTPVVALCGKVWVPSRNPDKFPVCPECKEIFESMKR